MQSVMPRFCSNLSSYVNHNFETKHGALKLQNVLFFRIDTPFFFLSLSFYKQISFQCWPSIAGGDNIKALASTVSFSGTC